MNGIDTLVPRERQTPGARKLRDFYDGVPGAPMPTLLCRMSRRPYSLTAKSAIASAEARLAGTGRLVVRASGTEPLIRIMAEGDDEALVAEVVHDIAGAVRKSAA